MSARPRLTRSRPPATAGIVHLGPGAFFKAFNAVYTDAVLRKAGGAWGIIAVSLQSDRAARALRPQGCAYTSVSLGARGKSVEVIESISDVLVASDAPGTVLDVMSDPRIRIVSLTITEKGYCHNPATGALNLKSPEIARDLQTHATPVSAPGFLVEALARRRASGIAPFTVLSCDNLPDNGPTARRIVLELARARDTALATWIEVNVPFPATMVDRITPATTPEDIAALEEETGYHDPACVFHEPFGQWVIEDDFAQGRPDWSLAGAQFVTSVAPHEKMKLRCLNGTHSTLAYLGYLAGYDTISSAVANTDFAALCETLWQKEILPTLAPPEGEDLNAYTAALMTRYRNPAIRHRTWQIAMDGSQKLPQRLLATIQDRLDAGTVPAGLCLAVAGWMRYVGGIDEAGQPIDVRDPFAERLNAASRGAATPAERVAAFLDIAEVFPGKLARHAAFRATLTDALTRLEKDGSRAGVKQYLRQSGD
jgi:fructuronate reductase